MKSRANRTQVLLLLLLLGAGACGPGVPAAEKAQEESAGAGAPAAGTWMDLPKGEFVARTHRDRTGSMPYRIFVPADYRPDRRYPLVVWLHGGGGAGSDNVAQIEGDQVAGTQSWTTPARQAEHPAFVVAPQSPGAWAHSGVADLSRETEQVLEIVDDVSAEFAIDPRQRYVLGQSIGGLGVWNLVSNAPERFAAAVMICPVPGTLARAARAARLPIWVFQGDEDSPSFVSGSRDLVAALKAAGGVPRYTEYPQAGHDIWLRVFAEPDLMPWMFAQHR